MPPAHRISATLCTLDFMLFYFSMKRKPTSCIACLFVCQVLMTTTQCLRLFLCTNLSVILWFMIAPYWVYALRGQPMIFTTGSAKKNPMGKFALLNAIRLPQYHSKKHLVKKNGTLCFCDDTFEGQFPFKEYDFLNKFCMHDILKTSTKLLI